MSSEAMVTMSAEEYFNMRKDLERLHNTVNNMFIITQPDDWDKTYAKEHASAATVSIKLNTKDPVIQETLIIATQGPKTIPIGTTLEEKNIDNFVFVDSAYQYRYPAISEKPFQVPPTIDDEQAKE